VFTSGLSVNEFALLGRLGPDPLAQVMGASVVQAGWQYLPALEPARAVVFGNSVFSPTPTGRALANYYTEPNYRQVRAYKWRTEVVCELDMLTAAWNLARRQALDRLCEEATQVGADAVVGVHLQRSGHDRRTRTVEFVVIGTAIRSRLPDGASDRPPSDDPTLTALSVQDYWRLLEGGQEPVGLVASTVVVFASPPRNTRMRRARTTNRNQELTELSSAFQLARERVRTRLREQVAAAGGTGVVGVELSHSVRQDKVSLGSSLRSSDRRGWHTGPFGIPYRVSGRGEAERGGWMITMHAAGTAIRPCAAGGPPRAKPAIRIG
jgi:uncharacterized protein YbjQ (UPF0145 family)